MVTKMLSIIAWNMASELHMLKNITVGSKSPLFVLKATFHSSPFLILSSWQITEGKVILELMELYVEGWSW